METPESREASRETSTESSEPVFGAVKLKSAASQSKIDVKTNEGSAFGEVKLKKASEQP